MDLSLIAFKKLHFTMLSFSKHNIISNIRFPFLTFFETLFYFNIFFLQCVYSIKSAGSVTGHVTPATYRQEFVDGLESHVLVAQDAE